MRDNADKLWALIQLELWLRTFVDTRTTAPLSLDSLWLERLTWVTAQAFDG